MKRNLLSCLSVIQIFLLVASSALYAQERPVSGRVTSAEDMSPLPGVNVVVKGSSTGTVTDADGNYSLNAPSTGVLVFTFIGLTSQEIPINGRTSIDVAMAQDVQQLSEVVVTALNIPREKQSLGYSTQTVSGEAVSNVKQQNFVNSLSGKIAGVQIRTTGQFGGSTNILIRGNKSVSGNNQPLFVVDGVPIDNRTGNSTFQQAGRMGFDYGNSSADINPEDIESINVLKGAGAAALYGSRAANGVVMITTKKGTKRKGIGVNFSTGVTAGRINKETFVDYQKEYGSGYAVPYFEYYGPQGFYEEDIDGDGVDDLIVPTGEDGSYGARFDPNLNVYHWDSFVRESPNYNRKYPWTAAAHMPDDFFETQMEYNNSVALSGGNEGNSFRLGYTNFNMKGFLPNAKQQRHNLSFTGTTKFSSKFDASINANYVFTDTKGRPSTGYGDNQMANFRQWWQTNVDIFAQRDIFKQTGRNITWNGGDYHDPETPIYWDNPYWTRYKNYQTDERSRIFGNVTLNYKFTDWLTLTGRAAVDSYTELREERRAVGSVPTEFGLIRADGTKADEGSGYQREDRVVTEANFDAFLTANRDISDDLNIQAMIGTNIRKNHFNRILTATNGGLVVPNLYSINNSALPVGLPQEIDQKKEVYGLLGNINLGWRNMIYAGFSARNDVSSALPPDNNSYFYHSEELSFVLSEAFKADFMDYAKVRVNYAEVGNDTDPENTINTYTKADNFGDAIVFSYPTIVRNNALLPEKTKSWETGLEFRGIDNRLTFDMSLYKTNSINQIIQIETSRASGMGFKFVNGGDIQNKGIELAVAFDVIRNNDFTWNFGINWSKNVSKVLSLAEGVDNYVINSFQGGVSGNVTVGQPYGVIRGTGFQFLNGQRVVTPMVVDDETGEVDGGYYRAVADQVIGDPNPDWNGGIMNSFSYKGINVSFLVDIQRGGDVYSLDMHYGQGTGISTNTVGLNDLGNPIRNRVELIDPTNPELGYTENSGGVILPGVQDDGSVNTVRARADYYGGVFYWGNANRNPSALTVYDAGYVKLRELSIGYSLPKTILPSVFQRATLSLVGRNLWIIDKNLPYADPESGLGAGNAQGYSSGAYPTLRTLGFKLDLDF